MDIFRYQFSKYSEVDINNFKKFAESNTKSNAGTAQTWKFLFPVFENDVSKEVPCVANEIICISDDEEPTCMETENVVQEYTPPSQKFMDETFCTNNTLAKDNNENVTESIKELIENGVQLSENDILELHNLKASTLKSFFIDLNKTLDLNAILLLSNSLCSVTCSEKFHIAKCFTENVLLEKILEDDQTQILEKILSQFTDVFEDTVCNNLIVPIILAGKLPKIIVALIKELPCRAKEKILKNVIISCEKLEENHLEILGLIISASTDFMIFKKVLELMVQSSEEYMGNLSFGKFLVFVLKMLRRNICKYESDIKFIVATHNTMYKSLAEKILIENMNDISQMSETQM